MEPGELTRCYAVRCAICARTKVFPAKNKDRRDGGAAAQAERAGWKRTSQLGDDGQRLWICAKHHEPGSYALYADTETDRRPPSEVYNDLP